MTNTLILAATSGNSSQQVYTQSVEAIQDYTSWIATQQNTGNSQLDSILNTCKTNASAWYNTIYPTYLMMPETIMGQGKQIDSDINILITLGQQLQTSDTPQIRQSISEYAANLIQILQTLENETKSLSTELATFQTNMNADSARYQTGMSIISQDIQNYQNQLMQLYGQLHSLENAACPSSSDINACKKQIQTVQNEINQYEGYMNVFNTGAQKAHNAAIAAGYLQQYWMTVSADITNCIQGLQNIQNEPAVILNLDLTAVQTRWNNIKTQFQQIEQKVASSYTH